MKRSREPDEAPPDPTSPSPPQSSGSVNISGDEATSPPASKIIELDPSALVGTTVEMRCALPPHSESLVFATYDEYEAHYFKTHTNRCIECRKNFPSAHLLSVHIEEMHDSFVLVKRERGERTVSPAKPCRHRICKDTQTKEEVFPSCARRSQAPIPTFRDIGAPRWESRRVPPSMRLKTFRMHFMPLLVAQRTIFSPQTGRVVSRGVTIPCRELCCLFAWSE